MRWLLDQNLPRPTATLLRKLGHDAIHTEEIGMERTADPDLIDLALAQSRYIATMDKDFPAIISTRSLRAPSTVLLRLKNPDEFIVCAVIQRICMECADYLVAGSLITATADSFRIRSLPVHLLP